MTLKLWQDRPASGAPAGVQGCSDNVDCRFVCSIRAAVLAPPVAVRTALEAMVRADHPVHGDDRALALFRADHPRLRLAAEYALAAAAVRRVRDRGAGDGILSDQRRDRSQRRR